MNNQTTLSLGLMSGTSMDGIDAALLRTDGHGRLEELGSASLRYDPTFHHALKLAEYSVRHTKGDIKKAESLYSDNAQPYFTKVLGFSSKKAIRIIGDISDYFHLERGRLPTFSQVIDHSTNLHARLTNQLIQQTQMKPDVIGYHGQNLYHAPARGITLQLGNAQRLADLTSTPVISSFRENDVENGGQGAPLAPLYHQALAISNELSPLAIVNCGGVSNVSFIFGSGPDQVMGFDTGPGNGLVDLYIKCKTEGRETYDKDGTYGLKGRVDRPTLQALQRSLEGYLRAPPPKSLDIADFSLVAALDRLSLEDGCCTLEAFTAQTIVDSIQFLPANATPPKTWVLAGGGWQNPVIHQQFCSRLHLKIPNATVHHAHEVGLDPQALEAQIFAYLAVRSLKGLPLSVPFTTGVSEPMTGGVLTYPGKLSICQT